MIWVDPLTDRGWALGQSCHLFGDTRTELIDFAVNRLGMREVWYQDHPTHPHFDLVASKRQQAVAAGAVELTTRDSLMRLRQSDVAYCPLRGIDVPVTECATGCPAPEHRVVCAMESW